MAWLAARLGGAKTWLHVQDFEVDVAFNMGLLKGGWVRRAAVAAECFVLRRFDRVSSISQRMLERAASKGVAADRLVLLPNWVDVQAIRPLTAPSRYRATLGLRASDLVVLFAGSLGSKHRLQLIPETARQLADAPGIHFVICGEGAMKPELLQLCAGLDSVSFLPLQPADQLGELLGLADIHLLPQDALAEDLVLPSKLSGMLASGRPVVATCAQGTDMAIVVQACGLVVPPGDAVALAAALRSLASNPEICLQMGQAARLFATDRLARKQVLGRWLQDLSSLATA
jgi:colanic acid biosynthesis glycosyl transferase WcaI